MILPSVEEMASGPVVPSVQRPSLVPTSERDVIKRYTRVLRSCHRAVMELFEDVHVLGADDELISVPLKLGNPERALAALFATVPKGESGGVARQKLPLGVLTMGDIEFDQNRFTHHKALRRGVEPVSEGMPDDTMLSMSRGIPVNIPYTLLYWAKYVEDINQIIEQVFLRFSPCCNMHIEGVGWESLLWFDGTSNNISSEGGEDQPRIVKYEFQLRLETYIPQPLRRTKIVKTIRVDVGLGEPDDPALYESIDELVHEVEEGPWAPDIEEEIEDESCPRL